MGSYSIEEIVARIRQVLTHDKNTRIINLESEDTGAYGIDIGTNIAELLEAIIPVSSDQPCFLLDNKDFMFRS